MVSRRAEELAVIIRMHLVEFMATERKQCLKCGVIAEGVCLSCAEVTGNELGRRIEEHCVREMGGLRLTIPTLVGIERREKHRQVRKNFKGDNHKQLALELGYTVQTIYTILAKEEPEPCLL